MSGRSHEPALFEEVTAVHWLHLPPRHINNLAAGTREYLARRLLRYCGELKGIPLSYGKVDLQVSETARIAYENPCLHLPVRVMWTVFCPHEGIRLRGTVNMMSAEHIGLLILGYFNATLHASQVLSFLAWDEDEQAWRHLSMGNLVVPGEEIEFEVLELEQDAGVMTIIGSLDKLNRPREQDTRPDRKREIKSPKTSKKEKKAKNRL